MRALAALVLLVLFPLVAVLLAAASVVLALWSLTTGSPDLARVLVMPGMTVLVVLVVATLSLSRARRVPTAVEVSDPQLWALVKEVAARTGTPPPDRLRLIAEPNAWVFRIGALRYLDVGLPLPAVLDVDQMRSVLAHEMGHHSSGHVPFASAVYQGYELMTRIVAGLGPSPLRPVLRGHLALYWRVASKVLRDQEMAADRVAVTVTDAATTASALLEITRCGAVWENYLTKLGAPDRIVPGDVCGGFREFYRSPEGAEIRAVPSARQVPGDTHPPMAHRIAAIGAVEDRVGDPVALAGWTDLTQAVDELLFPAAGRDRLPVKQYLAETRRDRDLQTTGRLFRAAQRIGGKGDTAGVLDLLENGRAPELAKEILRADPRPRLAQVALVSHLAAALELTADGDSLQLAKAAVAGDVREARGALTSTVLIAPPQQTFALLGAMTAVDVNGRPFVLILLEHGLALLPTTYIDPTVAQTVEQIQASGVLPENAWRLWYEDFAAARVAAGRKLRMDIELRDGTRLVLREVGVTEALTLGPRSPHGILAGVAAALEGVQDRAPRRGLPLATPKSAKLSTTIAATESYARRLISLVLILAAVPFAAAAATGTSPGAIVPALACAITGLLWFVIDAAMRPNQTRWRGLGFSLSGLVIIAAGVVGLTYAFRPEPVAGFAAFGVGLLVLGVLRWRGRWLRIRGNGFKVTALLAACMGAGLMVRDGVAGLVLLMISAVLFGVGEAFARSVRRSLFGVPDRVSVAGAIALFTSITGVLGIGMAVWAIVEARRMGVRPTLGLTALALSIAVLVILWIVLVTNSAPSHS
ncbi:Zn-dependent protease with chaperone function [Kibdelosporangium banguiense]|uniref:Zn-dependent protease with chaperone function n=1 Tax=Kibdelosporangium banguiense TaxID=1365924 RepID=A0ABS4U1J8_9PSEU|nr:M48 family metallopeptidase [Kibdelosporangium banguiense]MBP2330517.1 Zn-dependent protease with chaperone function [Kibdelosporangium banguiense]